MPTAEQSQANRQWSKVIHLEKVLQKEESELLELSLHVEFYNSIESNRSLSINGTSYCNDNSEGIYKSIEVGLQISGYDSMHG